MNRIVRLIRRILALSLVILLNIESFAAVVSDNDGSAFITKAEFDSLKNDFQAQIDNYNTSIDSKIDGAIAAYLSGIKISIEENSRLLAWPGKTVGLVEDHRSHPYKEGKVGGTFTLSSWVCRNSGFLNGTTAIEGSGSAGIDYIAYCFHQMTNKGEPFKYLVASYGKIGTEMMWDLNGYGDKIDENFNCVNVFRDLNDYTNSGTYSIGLCAGWNSQVGEMGKKIKDQTNYTILSCCEYSINSDSYGRGGDANSVHNRFSISSKDCDFSSKIRYDDNLRYLTNVEANTVYKTVWPAEWYGVNESDLVETHDVNIRDLYDSGWRLPNNLTYNFHIKTYSNHTGLYPCNNKAFMRRWKSSAPSASEKAEGWRQIVNNTSHHSYRTKDQKSTLNLFKSSTGTNCTSSNLYSSELGEILKVLGSDKVKTATIDEQSKTVAPLYVGVPIANVKDLDKVSIELEFLDDTDYTAAFKIGEFPEGTIEEASADTAGCSISGENKTNKIDVKGSSTVTKKTVSIDVSKNGILFFKFAVNGENVGRIKLPVNVKILHG